MAPATFKATCDIVITNFPFDSQKCEMTFGSWTYDNRLVSLKQLHDRHQLAGILVMMMMMMVMMMVMMML